MLQYFTVTRVMISGRVMSSKPFINIDMFSRGRSFFLTSHRCQCIQEDRDIDLESTKFGKMQLIFHIRMVAFCRPINNENPTNINVKRLRI